ncbi:MAG: hypothetical protein ACI8WB_005220 [Phenylobacterium sp.]|jgi:hypothetical protein
MMKKLIVLTGLLLWGNLSHAGSGVGKVKHLMVHEGDVVMFSTGPRTEMAECSTVGDDWMLSIATEKGKAMYAMLLASAAQGLTVSVQGHGACNVWPGRESVKFMSVVYP